jgi:hypothetical protein
VSTSAVVDFQPCDNRNQQKWSYDNGGGFQGLAADGSALSYQCINGASRRATGRR